MRKTVLLAALAATLSSAGCVTTLGIATSAVAKDDESGATVKRVVFGVLADAAIIAAAGAIFAPGPILAGAGDH